MSPKFELLKSFLLPDFPSGSSINYHEGKFYLIGDDANDILILDKNYQSVNSIHIFNFPDKRIPKPKKVDFETSTLLNLDGKDYLLVLGSASMERRMNLNLISLNNSEEKIDSFQYKEFALRMRVHGIDEINIEGSARIGNHLVLANRGNRKHPTNHLITTELNFWLRQSEASMAVSQVICSDRSEGFLGVSELCYVASMDLLFFTLSSELTDNAYDDGVIGDSYLGWINNITPKLNAPQLMLDGLINLPEVSNELRGEKIEGICVEGVIGNELTLHLISDNDHGQSKLFKIRMII